MKYMKLFLMNHNAVDSILLKLTTSICLVYIRLSVELHKEDDPACDYAM